MKYVTCIRVTSCFCFGTNFAALYHRVVGCEKSEQGHAFFVYIVDEGTVQGTLYVCDLLPHFIGKNAAGHILKGCHTRAFLETCGTDVKHAWSRNYVSKDYMTLPTGFLNLYTKEHCGLHAPVLPEGQLFRPTLLSPGLGFVTLCTYPFSTTHSCLCSQRVVWTFRRV